jgi:hypothetical protein
MRKTPTLFTRDPDDMSRVTDQVNPGCEWVLAGEGVPTRKYDGTCVMLDEQGQWWARREVKRDKAEPAGFVEVDRDTVTGKRVGWEPIDQSPFVKAFRDALDHTPPLNGAPGPAYPPGTYELCGPKINRNPERFEAHTLVRHADAEVLDLFVDPADSWTYDEIVALIESVAERGWEGLVWHHPDGRMVKLKVRDFR